MVGHLRLHNELHGDFLSLDAVKSCHDETITATTKLVPKLISFNEIGVELVSFGELRRKNGGIGAVMRSGNPMIGRLLEVYVEIAEKRRNVRVTEEGSVILLWFPMFQARPPTVVREKLHTTGAR